jgi:hypothetical protein
MEDIDLFMCASLVTCHAIRLSRADSVVGPEVLPEREVVSCIVHMPVWSRGCRFVYCAFCSVMLSWTDKLRVGLLCQLHRQAFDLSNKICTVKHVSIKACDADKMNVKTRAYLKHNKHGALTCTQLRPLNQCSAVYTQLYYPSCTHETSAPYSRSLHE